MDELGLQQFATDIARQAGDIIHAWCRGNRNVVNKANNTPLTAADTDINQLLIAAVQKRFPDHGVLGEELSYQPSRSKLWVCDPVDGTRALTIGEPTSTVSLAYVEDGQPLVAVVFDPWQRRMFTAIAGKGAFCDDAKLHVSDRSLNEAYIAGSGSLSEIKKAMQLYESFKQQGATVRFFGSMVFKGCLIAEGLLDGRLFPYTTAHDIAAVKLLVEEAGGKVTDLYGQEQRYDQPIRGAIVSNSVIHQQLVDILADFGTETFLTSA